MSPCALTEFNRTNFGLVEYTSSYVFVLDLPFLWTPRIRILPRARNGYEICLFTISGRAQN